ncbi:MAG: hypothetical protein JXP73_12670 [Deltaproteobacteria bacterium]|jgi:rhodanese-related sulfurtransferase|nr:hypothetical protein [Deltaproteobacteria bacterium]
MSLRGPHWGLAIGLLVLAGCEGRDDAGTADAGQASGNDAGAIAAPDLPGEPDAEAAAPDLAGLPDVGPTSPDSVSLPDAGPVSPDLARPSDAGPDSPDLARPSDVGPASPDLARPSDAGPDSPDLAGAPDAGTALPPWPDVEDKYISIDEVYARLQAGDPEMLLVNVVDEMYYNYGFIPGSLKIPYDTLEGRLAEVDPTRHIVLYCRRGVRSESAYTTLVNHDYPLVWVMEGGIEKWSAAGYPTVPE